jgi:hypothetical protein
MSINYSTAKTILYEYRKSQRAKKQKARPFGLKRRRVIVVPLEDGGRNNVQLKITLGGRHMNEFKSLTTRRCTLCPLTASQSESPAGDPVIERA